MNRNYNICFTLGDPSGDGHANTSEYHIVTTHSVEEITNAYKKTTELLGFNFVKEIGAEFEGDSWIPQEYTKKLLELNIIDDEYITTEDHQYGPPAGCYWFDYAEDEFLEVFFNIVRYSLPYFEWTPKEYHLWFIRGLIDGDGCFYIHDYGNTISRQFSIASAIDFDWSYIKSYLEFLGLPCSVQVSSSKLGKSSHLRCSDSKSIKEFIELLYRDDDGIYLPRKYNKAKAL